MAECWTAEMLQHGDPVVWCHVPRGGYGFGARVLALHLGVTAKRHRIRVFVLRDDGQWEVRRRTVRAESLRMPSRAESDRIALLAEQFNKWPWRRPTAAT